MSPLVANIRAHWAEYLFGIAFICIYAHTRFNTPPTQKYGTTRRQYHVAYGLYLAVLVAGYLLFSYSPALFNLTNLGGDVPESIRRLSPPLMIALFLTVLLPHTPILKEIDSRLLAFFWDKASIPDRALGIKKVIKAANFAVPDARQERMIWRLRELDPSFDFSTVNYRFSPWVKVSALLNVLEEWKDDPNYLDYRRAVAPECAQLAKRCDEYFTAVKDLLRAAREDDHDADPRRQSSYSLDRQVDGLLDETYVLIAQGVTHCEPDDDSRDRTLQDIGFLDARCEPQPRPPEAFVLVFLVVMAIFLTSFTMIVPSRGRTPGQQLFDSARIAMLYCLSVACAAFIPRHGRARRDTRPAAIARPTKPDWQARLQDYAITALAALLLCLVATLVCYRMEYPSWGAAVWRFAQSFPYLLMCFFTAGATAYLIDTRPPRLAWLVNGAALAAGSVLTAILVHGMLVNTAANTQPYSDEHNVTALKPRGTPPRAALLGIAGVTGFFIGALVPTWYRGRNAQPTASRLAADVLHHPGTRLGIDPATPAPDPDATPSENGAKPPTMRRPPPRPSAVSDPPPPT